MHRNEQHGGNNGQHAGDERRRPSLDPATARESASVGQVIGTAVRLPHVVGDGISELLAERALTRTHRLPRGQSGAGLLA